MSGPLLASYWKDNRIVYYLSSCHRPVADQTTERRNKDGTSIELLCTHTVTDYAKYMGGVDRLDQSTRLIKEKKTMRWYRRIEIKLRGTVMDHSPSGTRSRDLLSFRMDVAHELIGNTQVRRAFKRIRQLDTDEVRLDEIAHWPVSSGSADRLCNRSKTTLMCDKCNVPLCVNARSTCFVDFHTKVCYWQ
ncbi:hypothetical protein ACJMK2_032136 [Sinanodonta woodiana]|uniref:PiggyBac transposable element-derived protein domain-containing protein n=1 Tax=Sinanodonta woodiana TaxID=1069815 RepID=A0ABD3X0U2_SINWO